MAGWGGYDDATDAALGAFVAALEEGRLDREGLVFGLGAVVFLPEAAGDNEELAAMVREANQKLAERIRQLGTERVVYATDWPAWPPGGASADGIEKNLELVESALPLTEEEMAQVLDNVSAVFGGRDR